MTPAGCAPCAAEGVVKRSPVIRICPCQPASIPQEDNRERRTIREALARFGEDEKGVGIADTPGGPQEMNVVDESGIYALAFRSRKPEVEEFATG